jgi:hypothetical protein
MTYFLLTGDEDADLIKLKMLLDDSKIPRIEDHRQSVRIEAENFRFLNGYAVEYGDREVSHRLNVRLQLAALAAGQSTGTGSITTTFNDVYAIAGRYDVEVRYFDEKDGRSELSLYVNGIQQGAAWRASVDDDSWRIRTIPDVAVNPGDEIVVAVQGDSGEYGKLDYVQLNYRRPAAAGSGASSLDNPRALLGQVIVAGSNCPPRGPWLVAGKPLVRETALPTIALLPLPRLKTPDSSLVSCVLFFERRPPNEIRQVRFADKRMRCRCR